MIIGINAAAAVKKPRTGVEEYTYQLIKHLTMLPEAKEHRFLLYLPAEARRAKANVPEANTRISTKDTNKKYFDFSLPPNFEVKILRWPLPILWTQVRFCWEMLRRGPEVLFIPVHILPFFAPKNSVVTIHGLEYEYFPQCYPFWQRLYLRWSTIRALKRARRIIAISENTKQDLIRLYGGQAEKIVVVHHGIKAQSLRLKVQNQSLKIKNPEPYILYIGRIETKKNIQGILEAYKILKEKYNIPHQLVLAGAPGYGYNKKFKAQSLKLKVVELGYVSEDEKWQLLASADIFLFPSFYEGFGLPILEAQIAGVPVVTSYASCLPEIAGQGALFINPKNPAQIAEGLNQIIDDNVFRDKLIQLGRKNTERFNWEKCARETLKNIL